MIYSLRKIPVWRLITLKNQLEKYDVNISIAVRNCRLYNEYAERVNAGDHICWVPLAEDFGLSVVQAKRICYRLAKSNKLKTNNSNVNTAGNTASSTKSIRRFTKRNRAHC